MAGNLGVSRQVKPASRMPYEILEQTMTLEQALSLQVYVNHQRKVMTLKEVGRRFPAKLDTFLDEASPDENEDGSELFCALVKVCDYYAEAVKEKVDIRNEEIRKKTTDGIAKRCQITLNHVVRSLTRERLLV